MVEVTRKSEVEEMLFHYRQWQLTSTKYLWDVYGKFSQKKVRAYEYCEELMHRYGGRGLRILSHNTYMFTVGFECCHPETGEACFAYITPSHDRYVKLPTEEVFD